MGTLAVSTGLYSMTNIGLIATEDIALNQSDTSPVSISLGSGSVLTPTIAKFLGSGAATLNKGGFIARIQSPQSFSSGAILRRFSTECGAKTTAQLATAGINEFANQGATGVLLIRRNVNLSAGTATVFSTGSWKVNDGHYLVIATASGAAAGNSGDCVVKAEWSELYTATH